MARPSAASSDRSRAPPRRHHAGNVGLTEHCPEVRGRQMGDLIKALADVRTHLRTVLVSTCPDEHKVALREALAIVDNAIGNSDSWSEQDVRSCGEKASGVRATP